MTKALIIVGVFDEIIVDVEHIVSVESVAKVDRAGQLMLPPKYDVATFDGSSIHLTTGSEILVPQSLEEVFDKMRRAVNIATN